MKLQVTVTGDKAAIARLKRTDSGLIDLRVPLTAASRYLASYYAGQAFASRGGVFGERWAPLSPAYDRQKTRKYPGRPMLIRTGLMQRSFDFEVHPQEARIFNDARTRSGFNYFAPHQRGTGSMPRRAMMGVNNTIEREVVNIINRHVQRQVARG